MPVGAVLAVWFVMAMTDSQLADLGGPIDIVLMIGIAVLGAIGGAIFVYTVERLVFRRSLADEEREEGRIHRRSVT
jgi:uncharacterized protein (DUF2062 family)